MFPIAFQLESSYTCVSFTVQRWYPVANLTRYIPIRVYDYYAPGEFTAHWQLPNTASPPTLFPVRTADMRRGSRQVSLIEFFRSNL